MKLFLTGDQGDVGSMLAEVLRSEGAEITGNISEADRVFHMAAKSPPSSATDIITSNLVYLQEILDKCLSGKVRDFIFFSAASVYGDNPSGVLTEDSPCYEASLYGASKLMGESMIRESGINALCLRIPAVLGLKNTTNLPSRIFCRAERNEDIVLYNSDKEFSNFISVNEIAGFISVLRPLEGFDIVNLRTGAVTTLGGMAEKVVAVTGSSSFVDRKNTPKPFFSLSIDKAVKKYDFSPCRDMSHFDEWVRKRHMMHKNGVLS
ncbi:MAG: NAD-dependent epimerase/dehydratase family protein [Deferribacterales bacterium]